MDSAFQSNGRAFYTIPEVAALLRCSVATVRRLVRSRAITVVQMRGKILISALALQRYVDSVTRYAVGEQ